MEKDMELVLQGMNILRKLPNEFDYHYKEENWKRYSNEQQLMIRKWIRFMFNHKKNIDKTRSSYGLKHLCEETLGFYVHNDAIKKAMLLENFIAETGTVNWNFNISGEVTLKKTKKFKELFKEELEKI